MQFFTDEAQEMKNIIPLVVSVVLGLAAVYIVSKLLFEKEENDTENKVSVVVAARALDAHDELTQGRTSRSLRFRKTRSSGKM